MELKKKNSLQKVSNIQALSYTFWNTKYQSEAPVGQGWINQWGYQRKY